VAMLNALIHTIMEEGLADLYELMELLPYCCDCHNPVFDTNLRKNEMGIECFIILFPHR
jgi:hypothetical protein